MQRATLLLRLHHHFVTAFLRGDVAWLSSCKLHCSKLCNFWENRSACKNVFSILLFRLMTVTPPSPPPLASLETEEYFRRRTIMILGCSSCCCVFGPSFSSSERGSWTTSKEAAAVQTTTVGEALQKLLPKERRVVHQGFHYGFSGNGFIHYSLFAWNRYIFFLFKKYKKCYHLLHWKIERERVSPHREKQSLQLQSRRRRRRRCASGKVCCRTFFCNHICFCWGRALSRIQFSNVSTLGFDNNWCEIVL